MARQGLLVERGCPATQTSFQTTSAQSALPLSEPVRPAQPSARSKSIDASSSPTRPPLRRFESALQRTKELLGRGFDDKVEENAMLRAELKRLNGGLNLFISALKEQ